MRKTNVFGVGAKKKIKRLRLKPFIPYVNLLQSTANRGVMDGLGNKL